MRVITATNINDAYVKGVGLLLIDGEGQPSRVGEVIVMPCPVTTVYLRPMERVLFDAERDANPFFHLGEALWMLQGRNDAQWLDRFVANFSERFTEPDGHQHGAYGFRWLHHFDIEGFGVDKLPDQLTTIVDLLKANPVERRAVLTMWDPVADLGRDKKDLPCNTHVYFRVRRARPTSATSVLDMTVCCRSNDVIWGAYGANAVHFSVLLEYMAARIGVAVGIYYQISNNFHGYTNTLKRPADYKRTDPYNTVKVTPLVLDVDAFDDEVRLILSMLDGDRSPTPSSFRNTTLATVVWPTLYSYKLWRAGKRREAAAMIDTAKAQSPYANPYDWLEAAAAWYARKLKGEKT